MIRRLACMIVLVLAAVSCSGKPAPAYKPDPRALELNNSAVSNLQRRDLEGALKSVDGAIAADPGFVSAYANKGAILVEMGKDKEAIAAFKKAISMDTNFAEAYVPLGALYEKQGKTPYAKQHYEIAVRLYREMVKKDPDDARVSANLAAALFLSDDRSGALECLNSYLASHPADPTIARVKSKIEARDRKGLVPGHSGK